MKTGKKIETGFFLLFFLFIFFSLIINFSAGKEMGLKSFYFGKNLFIMLPPAFILIGLFQVWVKRETIEKHLGTGSGLKAHFYVILLAGTTVGGLYVAFPVAAALYSKGAKLSVIFTYLGAAAIVRIPMTIFEASFLGLKFTIIRFLISIPLVIISSEIFGRYLEARSYKMRENSE